MTLKACYRISLGVLFVLAVGLGAMAPRPGLGQQALAAEEFRLLPLRVHLLRAKAAESLNTKLEEADVRRILGKINGVWRQAGIQFFAESIRSEEARSQELYSGLGANRTEEHLALVRPRDSLSKEMFHIYYIAKMNPNGIYLNRDYQQLFVKDTAQLRKVPGGIDEDLPRVSSHEIGHALGLDHRQDTFNLMASGTTGTTLNEAEVALARKTAEAFGFVLKPEAALAAADKLAAEKSPAAMAIYSTLSGLPGGEIARTARMRLTEAGAARGVGS